MKHDPENVYKFPLRRLSKQVQTVLAERHRGSGLEEQNARARLKEFYAEIDKIISTLVEVGVSKALTAKLHETRGGSYF